MDFFTNLIGSVLDGRYRIEKLVGTGGMSCVFLAYDVHNNAYVAVKVLKPDIAQNEEAVRRFENEAKAIAMLSHPNIVSIYTVSTENDVKYIAMEYVNGETLKSYLKTNGRLDFNQTVEISLSILAALEQVHDKGVVHQDIKPSNMIFDHDGQIKLADFGIARHPVFGKHNIEEQAVGTVYYMSPEQASGKLVDFRSDIYSLGVLMYELVTGKLPFVGQTAAAVAYMQCHNEPVPPSEICEDIPKGLEQIILRAMSKSPDRRFVDDSQMIAYLTRLQKDPTMEFEFVDEQDGDSVEVNLSPDDSKDVLDVRLGITETEENKELSTVSKDEGTKIVPVKKTKVKRDKIVYIEKRSSKVSFTSMALGVFCGLFLVGCVSLFYLYHTFFTTDTTEGTSVIVVDDFIGDRYDPDYEAYLNSIGYRLNIQWETSSEYLVNTVISQTPSAGERRIIIDGEQYCELTLTVSSGENMLHLQNYIGVEYRKAEIEMRRLGLNVKFVREKSDVIEEGRIISTYPEAGTYIASDTLVTVYVSIGPEIEFVEMPDFTKMNPQQVYESLSNSDLKLAGFEYEYSNEITAGYVSSQNIAPGAKVPKGFDGLILIISKGPEPLPDPEPELPEDTENLESESEPDIPV